VLVRRKERFENKKCPCVNCFLKSPFELKWWQGRVLLEEGFDMGYWFGDRGGYNSCNNA
jgi:hypothetical protein